MKLYERAQQAAEYIASQTAHRPRVILVLGSGLGDYADQIADADRIPYGEIPGFATSTVPGHKGQLVLGIHRGVEVAVMQGRLHFYEGYRQDEITLPLRVLRLLGAEIVLLTNASGGINLDFAPGDLMLIDDHINFSGTSPLMGENDERFGPRFPDMSQAYDAELKQTMLRVAAQTGVAIQRGVYMMFTGPQFETPAEIRFARTIGADAAGMSTVPEVIIARHCGLRICAVSCITNMAAGILDQPLTHQEVMETGERVKETFGRLVDGFLSALSV